MSLLLRSRSFAAVSLVLVGAGLVAIACGSDSRNPGIAPGDSSTSGNQPNNSGNADNPSGNGTTTTPGNNPGNENPAGGTQNPANSGNEGPMGNIPVQQNPADNPGSTNNPNPDQMNPPANPGTPVTANCNPPEGAVPNLALQQVATGLTRPLYVTQAPGDDARLFIMEKAGTIRVVQDGQLQQTPFVDVSSMLMDDGNSERGLLGMAFHPDFATNGLFYLHFSSNGGQGMGAAGDTVVAEFKANADHSAGDPASRRILLTTAGLEPNHNGGQLAFGPDKLLYFGLGDGGGANDQHGTNGNGQNLQSLNAKILRLDPLGRDVNNAYSIPAGNLAAVTQQQALPEIWAYGLRNPWRFSFDACTGDLYIGDVGQNTLEEIDFLAAGADKTIPAGSNFGWRLMEGPNCRPGDTQCTQQTQQQLNLTQPVDSYGRMVGQSVTGGFVYRGSDIPGLRGTYIYADYQSARFFRFRIVNGAIADRTEITDQLRPAGNAQFGGISSFGSDNAGEMYVATFTPGVVYKVAAAP